jgi:hypothetical protein
MNATQPTAQLLAFCVGDRVVCRDIDFPAEGVVTDVSDDICVEVQWPDCQRTTEPRAGLSHVASPPAHIAVWILTVCEDGQLSTELHRTHQDALAELLTGWGRLTESYTDVDLAEMDDNELSEVFADAGVDYRIEEVRIDLREFPPVPDSP